MRVRYKVSIFIAGLFLLTCILKYIDYNKDYLEIANIKSNSSLNQQWKDIKKYTYLKDNTKVISYIANYKSDGMIKNYNMVLYTKNKLKGWKCISIVNEDNKIIIQTLPNGKVPIDIDKYINLNEFSTYVDCTCKNQKILFKNQHDDYSIITNSKISNLNAINDNIYYFYKNNEFKKIFNIELPIENCLNIGCSKIDKDSNIIEDIRIIYKIRNAS
ncbi:hypothetical protein G8S55_13140 [Clostridium botulinum C]|uniref:hypothetical protein n=1 Tax=Clostridium botulinum TaxID=1491 RepID=UPI001E4A6E32|nr:hypothetical protein [Clostridium botulinum]MCD3218139.1 hypothetical protein [Clostridium botulinum C]